MKDPTGKLLEKEFSEWMEKNLGYIKTKKREIVKGKVADRGYEVDIHGIHYDRKADMIRKLGIATVALSIITLILPREFGWFNEFAIQIVGSIVPGLAGSSLLIVGIVGFIFGYRAKQRTTSHAWVECKDTKSNVKRKDIHKLSKSVEDVRNLSDAKWYPHKVIVVSASDFDHDALAVAEDEGIECFKKTEDGFEKIL
jgi:hypothetical protein